MLQSPWEAFKRHALTLVASGLCSLSVAAAPKAPQGRLWSLEPLSNPQPPVIRGASERIQPVDAFIRVSLDKAGLAASPEADKRTLIRRATMDLTGLPPTPEEVAAFIADASPEAYPKLIERLLSSPHYGEQWARHWLDLARYSDTKGYVFAREEKRWIHAAAYRDWVASAFNNDMPYDQFVRLQIAADQLAPAGSPDLAAMGFLTLGQRFLGVSHDIIDDRIDVVSRTLLGLTVGCARCHDHKYDPIPTRDYYALYGVFSSSAEKVVACGSEAQDEAFIKELRAREKKQHDTLTQRREEQAARTRARVKDYLVAQLELEKYPDELFGQILDANDLNPFVVHRWQAFLAKDKQSATPIFAEWHGIKDPIKLRESAEHSGVLFADIEKKWRDLLKSTPAATALPDATDERLRGVLYGVGSPCYVPDEHIANIELYFPEGVIVEMWKLQGEVDRWVLDHAGSAPRATILVDRPVPATPRVFNRGNPLNKGDEVTRHFLTALGGGDTHPFTKGSGRLELANAIADPRNPLTARVMVNRVWMNHFGRGLVKTTSDFGRRAEPPTHPELLDWLANKFIASGWSLKELHRLIMLSHTYRQTITGPQDTGIAAKAQKLDPDNRLLWRMTAHRLSFEEARDSWLAASGDLRLNVGGKPEPLFSKPNLRRTLYGTVDRENVPAVLRTFDFANPDLPIPQRSETTVPQQALFGMNHPFIAERATNLAKRLTGAPTERVRQLYAQLYQRAPTETEMTTALDYVQTGDEPPAAVKPRSPWTYGFGEFDEGAGKVKAFAPLPYFNGSAWQGGSAWPDAKLGWAQITATGGHPGNDRKHAVVRRWTAPQDGSYALRSLLVHEPEVGDGIRAFVSHSTQGLLRSSTVHHSKERIDLDAIAFRKGETLDFTVDIRDGLNSDQFLWAPALSMAGVAGSGGDTPEQTWSAEKDFAGQPLTLLTPWQQLAQVLMLANEFMFVD